VCFKSADRLRDLLRFAVYETLEGRGNELKEYVLGATTLGRGDSFDPKTDPIVHVQMRRLREHLHLYYSTEGRSQAVVIEIPKGTYAPTLRVAAPEAVPLPARLSEERFMVGRDSELAALRAAFASAATGHGGLFLLAGEPGIGKTTVVEAFLSEIAASEVRCYFARRRCSERLAGSEANCQCWRRSIPWSELVMRRPAS